MGVDQGKKTAGNYAGLHVGDYIPITCSNGYKLNAQIAGMNTYTGYADQEVGNHIDFICKELWNDLHVMNKIDYNNGNANSPNPFLASDLNYWLNSMSGTVPNNKTDPATTVAVDYTAGGILYYLPDKLKNRLLQRGFCCQADIRLAVFSHKIIRGLGSLPVNSGFRQRLKCMV